MLDRNNMPGRVKAGTCYTTQDSMMLRGQQIDYRIDAQEFLFVNDADEPEASFFAYSMLRQNVENSVARPLMFVYEGGPGAASAEMFLGLFGPRVMKLSDGVCIPPTPPYAMEDNSDCLLDICDIVMVDPVGTGYAKLYDKSRTAAYVGVEADAAASRKFVAFWLEQYGRWNSPKYLCGKSYGAMRAAVFPYFFLGGSTDPQLGQFGIGFNGTIILCDANVADLRNMRDPRLTAPDQPPELDIIATLAAINHYHYPDGKPGLRQFVDEAHAFAYGAYAHALLMGRALPKDEQLETARQMSYYIGLPAEALLAKGLHITIQEFSSALMAQRGKTVSLYDGRFLRDAAAVPGKLHDNSSDDPLLLNLWTAEVTLMHEFLKNTLHIDWDREYLVQNYQIGWDWDFTMSNNARPNELLTVAVNRNAGMHVFMGKGLFDCVTPIGDGRYTISHYDLPRDRLTYREYEAGHALWHGTARGTLCDDLRIFIKKSLRS